MKRTAFITGVLAAGLAPCAAPAAMLRRQLQSAVAAIPGSAGIYARTMAGGQPLFSHDSGRSFPSASIIKLVIALTAFERERANPSAMNAEIVFHRNGLIGGSEFLASRPDGARFTVHQLVVPMIQLSDNTAANLLIEHFGFTAINASARRAGLKDTHLRRRFLDYRAIVHHMDNRTTAADMAHLLFELERGAREGTVTVTGPQQCRALLRIMLGQTDRNKIPAGLPAGTPCANKTGAVDGTRNDVAVVEPFGDSPYVLAVLTSHLQDYPQTDAAIARISRILYRRVNGTNL